MIYDVFTGHMLCLCRAGLLSESQRIQYTIEEETKDIPDARTYFLQLQEIRIKYLFFLFFSKVLSKLDIIAAAIEASCHICLCIYYELSFY
jgi:hypothetical protein